MAEQNKIEQSRIEQNIESEWMEERRGRGGGGLKLIKNKKKRSEEMKGANS